MAWLVPLARAQVNMRALSLMSTTFSLAGVSVSSWLVWIRPGSLTLSEPAVLLAWGLVLFGLARTMRSTAQVQSSTDSLRAASPSAHDPAVSPLTARQARSSAL
jgi:hypothetical protein